jgi:hypothetical protein
VIVAGVVWGGQRFLCARSAPKLAQDREAAAAPEPLPTEATDQAQTDDIPSAEDLLRAEVEQAPLDPPPALAKAPPPPTAAADRPSQTAPPATTRPPSQQQKLPTTPRQEATTRPATQPARPALALRPTTQPADPVTPPRQSAKTATQPARTPPTTAPASPPPTRMASAQTAPQPARTPPGAAPATPPVPTPANADATRELERCLGRLVRMCPSGGGGRPGFTEDGALSASERALLNQRSLFAWSDALSSNVANCSRHLNAAGQAGQTPYQPLATACRGLPTSGPPR